MYYPTLLYTILQYPILPCTTHTPMHYPRLPSTTLYCHTLPKTTMHYPRPPCTTLYCHTLPKTTMHYPRLPCTTLYCHTLSYTTQFYHTLPCSTLHFHALPNATMHYPMLGPYMHYPTLSRIILHYYAPPCTTMHHHTLSCTSNAMNNRTPNRDDSNSDSPVTIPDAIPAQSSTGCHGNLTFIGLSWDIMPQPQYTLSQDIIVTLTIPELFRDTPAHIPRHYINSDSPRTILRYNTSTHLKKSIESSNSDSPETNLGCQSIFDRPGTILAIRVTLTVLRCLSSSTLHGRVSQDVTIKY